MAAPDEAYIFNLGSTLLAIENDEVAAAGVGAFRRAGARSPLITG